MKIVDNRKDIVRDIVDGDLVMFKGNICMVLLIGGNHSLYNITTGKQETWYGFLSKLNRDEEIELLTDVYDISITISTRGDK